MEEKTDEAIRLRERCVIHELEIENLVDDVTHIKTKMATKASKADLDTLKKDGIKLHTTWTERAKIYGAYVLFFADKFWTLFT